jgi:hypothetical protein
MAQKPTPKSKVPAKGSSRVAPSKTTGKVPPESKKGNPKSVAAGKRGAAKSARQGYGKKKS